MSQTLHTDLMLFGCWPTGYDCCPEDVFAPQFFSVFKYLISGAASRGVPFTLSTIATSSIEQVAEGAPDALKFFQVYIYRDRDVTLQVSAE